MRHRGKTFAAHAAMLTVAGGSLVLAISAYAQEKPIGMLLAVGDISECLSKKDQDALKSKNKKERERAEVNAKNKTGAATATLIRQEIANAKIKYPDLPSSAIRVLALGDLAYNCGATSAFKCFDATWGEFKDILLPVPGNHEYDPKEGDAPLDKCVKTWNEPRHARPYFKYFENNDFAQKQQGFNMLRFPDKKDGPWLLVGLNPYTSLSTKDLKARLEQEKDMRCVLAFSHATLYSSGRHGHGDKEDNKKEAAKLIPKKKDMIPNEVKRLRDTFEVLHQTRASVMVAGHDHHYEQLGRANAEGTDVDRGASAKAEEDGVRSFVVGTGGTNLYSFPYERAWAFREAYDLKSHGILRIMLYPTSYEWAFVPTKDNGGSFKAVKDVKFDDKCNRP